LQIYLFFSFSGETTGCDFELFERTGKYLNKYASPRDGRGKSFEKGDKPTPANGDNFAA